MGCVGCGHDVTLKGFCWVLFVFTERWKETLFFFLCLPLLFSIFARCIKSIPGTGEGLGVLLEASCFPRTVFTLEELESYYTKQRSCGASLQLPALGQQPPSLWAVRREHTIFKACPFPVRQITGIQFKMNKVKMLSQHSLPVARSWM